MGRELKTHFPPQASRFVADENAFDAIRAIQTSAVALFAEGRQKEAFQAVMLSDKRVDSLSRVNNAVLPLLKDIPGGADLRQAFVVNRAVKAEGLGRLGRKDVAAAVVACVGAALGLFGALAGVAWWFSGEFGRAGVAAAVAGFGLLAVGGLVGLTTCNCEAGAQTRTVGLACMEGGRVDGRPSCTLNRRAWRNDFDCADGFC